MSAPSPSLSAATPPPALVKLIPLALSALVLAGGSEYGAAVEREVNGLFGANVLGVSLVDKQAQTIWRAITLPGVAGAQPCLLVNAGLALALGRGPISAGAGRYAVVHDSRSDHPGRLLHAALS